MSDLDTDVAPPRATPIVAPAARRRPIGLMLTGLVAASAVLWSDHLIRARQDLVSTIVAKNTPIFMPFSEVMSTKVEKKTTFNRLYDRLYQTRPAPDHTAFIKTSYELGDFINHELSEADPRRQAIMLDVVAVAGDQRMAADAYWALFLPDWQTKLQPQYPQYAAALTKIARDENNKGGNGILVQLAGVLRERNQPTLELQALRALHETAPVTVATAPAMERLRDVLPPQDPERVKLETDIAAYQARRDQLAASMTWYQEFATKQSKLPSAQLLTLRQTAPKGDLNAFTAAADAALINAYVKDGRLKDAMDLRAQLAQYDASDFEDSMMLATEASTAATPTAKGKSPSVASPDLVAVRLQQWRGLLQSGDYQKADAIADELFSGDLKSLRKAAEEEKFAAQGQFSKLGTVITLQHTTQLPPELTGATEALHAQLSLKPISKGAPADIHSTAEIWVAGDKCLFVLSADEPRTNLPAPKMTSHDQDVWKEDCFELFFNPDRWFDQYYQIDVNSAGVVFDARVPNTGTSNRRTYTKPDKSFDPKFTVTHTKTDKGWQVRLMLPRAPLLPDASGVIRFNARRFRYVTDKNNQVLQQFSWSASTGADHRPEQFGWLVLPK